VRRVLLLLAVVLAGAASAVSAQAGARVEVGVDPSTHEPRPRIRNLMDEERWREALDDAFRISLTWQVDLYRVRSFWFPSNESSNEFTIVIRREPLLGQYYITYFAPDGNSREYTYTSIDAFVLQLEQPLRINGMGPSEPGEYYYSANLRVSALDDQQFAEMQRFIGEGKPTGNQNSIGTAILKLVGLPFQNFSRRSDRFTVP
jgi:hypothetical protein